VTARPRRRLLDTQLADAIESLATGWAQAEAEVEPFMSPPQLRLLKILGTLEPMSVGTMAERMGSLPSSVTRLCNRLEAGGFVRRSTGTDDRREVLLSLTGNGRTFLERLDQRRAEYLDDVLGRMSAPALKALREGLAAYEKAVARDGARLRFPPPLMILRP